MRGLKHFIAKIENKYKESYKTEGGLEIYADRHFSIKDVANTFIRVYETPFNYEGPLKKGDLIFIDATVLMQQTYVKGGEQENINLIDRENSLFKILPSLIIAYSKDNGESWTGFNRGNLAEKIEVKKTELKSDFLEIPTSGQKKKSDSKFKLKILSEELKEQGLKEGDVVYIKKNLFVDVRFKEKIYTWIKNVHIMALEA